MKKMYILLLGVLSTFQGLAQLSLAPTAVFLDKNGIGNLFVTNNSGVAQEITIAFQFGYSDQDENGVLIMRYDDSLHAPNHALDRYVKAFPRSFILPAGQQQIVRLQARVPKNIPPGLLFTRLKVGSSGQVADIGSSEEATGINTKVALRFEQVIAAFYKNGEVNTGVEVAEVTTLKQDKLLQLDAFYRITGNAPFLGQVKLSCKTASGTLVAEGRSTVAMYFSGKRRFYLNMPADAPEGPYVLELLFETSRNDIAPEDLVQAAPILYKTTLKID